ncbi:MAG: hypothetical protein ACPGQL_04100 [Thermoplasmatota archaeon]
MIDYIGRVNMDYMVRLANDPVWAASEQQAILDFNSDNGATYDGKPIPCPVKPHFISPDQRQIMSTAVRNLISALNKFIDMWLESEELQELWGVTEDELRLYKADPGYEGAIQISRLDGFLQDYDIQFLEFNCDSPGGTGYADVIHRGFLEMFERNGMGQNHLVSDRQRQHRLAETLATCYQEWRLAKEMAGEEGRPARPFIVVSDWRDVGTITDINIMISHLEEAGFEATFADPRDFEHKEDGLYLGDKRVDLIYKRVIVKELVGNPDTAALRDAYLAGKVCMVNSPRSVIVGNKKIMAALHRQDVMDRLNADERRAVEKHVPWTSILYEGHALFQGYKIQLRDFVIDNKDKLVLKAAQSYGGKDVFLGFETTAEAWEELVDKHLHENTWVVQALVRIPKELFPELREGHVNMKLLNVNINPLAFGGEYAGAYSRVSEKNVINVSYGGGLVPAMTIEPKGELRMR